MLRKKLPVMKEHCAFPEILSVRQQANVINTMLRDRLETVLPVAMRKAELDMWLVLCREDTLDPVFTTLIPLDTWCPILQILVFYDRGKDEGVECINISGTNTHDLYDRPYKGQIEEEQWSLLRKIVEKRNPKRIGINTGVIQWAAGGLTHNLYSQLTENLSQKFVNRFESAETLVTYWLATLTDDEIQIYDYVCNVAHHLIQESYSRKAIVPGVTTTEGLEWYYWQRSVDLGLQVAYKPFFYLIRSEAMKRKFGLEDRTIRPGDFIRCDAGIRYLGLNTDLQRWAYVLQKGEDIAPEGARKLIAEANHLQDIFVEEFKQGLSGNELLKNILTRARNEGIRKPRVYSHSLGLFLHEPGPLIGLPWEQERCAGRGDVKLDYNNSFAMELSVNAPLPEWGNQEIRMALEEDVVFTRDGCHILDGRQTQFYLV